ncbi:MAG: alanine racemase [Candidatus Latescibacterota bacterium]|jgi:alanine racemase
MPNATETVLEIDLNAVGHNYRFLTSKLKENTKVLGVVKAMGYGSDAVAIARELVMLGVDYLAVAYTAEGVLLRDAGIETPILVLHPQPANFDTLIDRCLEPGIYTARVLKAFVALAEQKEQTNYPIHIKFNTGLNRLGFWENEVDWVAERLSETKAVKVKSIYSHLAASEDLSERAFTLQQIDSFRKTSDELIAKIGYSPLRHQSNTSAIINYPEAHFDMVRTGIGLSGYGNAEEVDKKLKPISALKSVISQIHTIEPGDSVGYNRGYTAAGYERTATIPIGHADGIPRAMGNEKACLYVAGKPAPIIGNVCMDMLMINITGIDCNEGDEVEIIGPNQTAVQLANAMDSIAYELLTAISQRVKRVVCRKL